MRLGSLNRVGLSLGLVAAIGIGAYVSGSYVPGNYAQSGGYTGAAARLIDAAIDAPPDAATTTMSVAITDSADPVITGADAYSYSVTLTNSGSSPATSVSVATTLDASLSYVSCSGTGWACSQSAGVVTATRASAAIGAQPAITINVTTGTSAVAASSSVVASAANASNATASQGTTVQLVSKDATAGIYFPATSTEWSNFIARKGLAMSTPDALWLCQDASGNLADAIGSFTLTAGGTGLAYQQTVTGYSRKAITFTDGSTGNFITSSASLPNLSTQSMLTMMVVKVTTTPTVARQLLLQGGAGTTNALGVAATTGVLTATAGSTASGASNLNSGSVDVVSMETNRTATTVTATTRAQALGPTWNGSVAGQRVVIAGGSTPAMAMLYVANWHASKGEATDANLKALEQAMGFTITR